jgi:hypothetical protein
MSSPNLLAWRAKPGCPATIAPLLERTVNSFPRQWLEQPKTGEVFDDLAQSKSRFCALALAEGWNVVSEGAGTKVTLASRYICAMHQSETRNTRGLEDHVERDKEGEICSIGSQTSGTTSTPRRGTAMTRSLLASMSA